MGPHPSNLKAAPHPESITARIDSLLTGQFMNPSQRIAVFDLDNTLLHGDIGEAVFAQLKNEEQKNFLTIYRRPIPLTWHRYRTLLEKNKKRKAYTRMVTAMAGLPLNTLVETTRGIIRHPAREIRINGDRIPAPAINPVMGALIQYLKKKSFRIFIISASNHFSVQQTARELFGLPEPCAFGIEPCLKRAGPGTDHQTPPVLTARLKKPLPYGPGKARLYHQRISRTSPLITAGDSLSDLSLLNLTHAQGLAIWMGGNSGELETIKRFMKYPGILLSFSARD